MFAGLPHELPSSLELLHCHPASTPATLSCSVGMIRGGGSGGGGSSSSRVFGIAIGIEVEGAEKGIELNPICAAMPRLSPEFELCTNISGGAYDVRCADVYRGISIVSIRVISPLVECSRHRRCPNGGCKVGLFLVVAIVPGDSEDTQSCRWQDLVGLKSKTMTHAKEI
jgi:hypothetical protein